MAIERQPNNILLEKGAFQVNQHISNPISLQNINTKQHIFYTSQNHSIMNLNDIDYIS